MDNNNNFILIAFLKSIVKVLPNLNKSGTFKLNIPEKNLSLDL